MFFYIPSIQLNYLQGKTETEQIYNTEIIKEKKGLSFRTDEQKKIT
jgi:hypothetical protein